MYYINPAEIVKSFKNLFFFKTRGTGPIIRDAKGFPCLFIKLTAFSLNEVIEPSFLIFLVLVRIINAL